MAELSKGEQVAYNQSVARTKKQAARERGAADALKDAPEGAVDRARARALGQVEAASEPAVLGTPAAAPQGEQKWVQVPARGKTYRVPDPQWYDATPEQKEMLLDAVDDDGENKRDESVAIKSVNQLLDLREKDRAELREVKGQLSTVLTLMEAMQRRMDQMDLQVQVAKSDELAEQQAALAQLSINLQGVGAAEQAAHDRRMQESQQQAVDHQARIEAAEEPVARLEGTLKSASTIYEQGIIANQGRLEQVDAGTRAADVRLQEVEGRVDVLGSPITRVEVKEIITTEVTAEVNEQAPTLVDQAVTRIRQDEFPSGFFGQRVDGDRTRQLRADAARMADQQQGVS